MELHNTSLLFYWSMNCIWMRSRTFSLPKTQTIVQHFLKYFRKVWILNCVCVCVCLIIHRSIEIKYKWIENANIDINLETELKLKAIVQCRNVLCSHQPAAVKCWMVSVETNGVWKVHIYTTHVATDTNDMVHFVCVYWNCATLVIDSLAGEFGWISYCVQCQCDFQMKGRGVSDSATDWEWSECLHVWVFEYLLNTWVSLSRLKCDSPFNSNISC